MHFVTKILLAEHRKDTTLGLMEQLHKMVLNKFLSCVLFLTLLSHERGGPYRLQVQCLTRSSVIHHSFYKVYFLAEVILQKILYFLYSYGCFMLTIVDQ